MKALKENCKDLEETRSYINKELSSSPAFLRGSSLVNQSNIFQINSEENFEIKVSNNKGESYSRIIDFPFKETILSIWERNGKKVHPKPKPVEIIEKPNPKIEETKKIDFPYNPYENFF